MWCCGMPDTAEYLAKNIKETVLVSLKTGSWVRGILQSFDRHLNLVLDNAEELVPLKSGEGLEDRKVVKLGKRVLIRGDVVVAISTPNRGE